MSFTGEQDFVEIALQTNSIHLIKCLMSCCFCIIQYMVMTPSATKLDME